MLQLHASLKNVIFCRPLDKDRFMAPDIEAVKKLLQENKIWSAVQHHIAYYHAPQVRQIF